jgi:glycosyltransferase involved in cell wall biosynthesis
MRVLLANKFFFNNGGSETVMFQERDFLRGSGVEIVDFSMAHERNRASEFERYFTSPRNYRAGSRFAKLRSALSLIHSREAVRRISLLIDRTRPDLLHCHNIYHQLTPSIIGAAKSRGVPVVLTLHDYKPVCPVHTRIRGQVPCSLCLKGDFRHVVRHRCADGSLTQSLALYAEAVVQRWFRSYEKVDRFLAPSRYMRDSVSRRFPSEKITLLYNGVDASNIAASTADDGYVLYCGRLAAGKGVETLLQAHQASRGAWPLVVAGTGPMAEELQSRFGQTARFTGQLRGPELERTIASASLVVVPSAFPENCPMSVLEGMAHGKPVVASRVGGIPEIVVDGVTGFTFEPADVAALCALIDRLMSNQELRAEMGTRARQRAVKDFSLEQHNENLMNIYTSLLSSSNATVN